MKVLIYISLLFLSINCFGQTETKEDFLNEVDTSFLWVTMQPYYLLDPFASTSYFNDTLKRNKNHFIESVKKFLDENSDTLITELVKQAQNDTTTEKWNFKKLKRAVMAANDGDSVYSIGKTKLNFLNGKKKKQWSKDSIDIINLVTTISKPVFVYDHQYAMIYLFQYYGFRTDLTPGHFNTKLTSLNQNTIFIYKKIKNRWVKIVGYSDEANIPVILD